MFFDKKKSKHEQGIINIYNKKKTIWGRLEQKHAESTVINL